MNCNILFETNICPENLLGTAKMFGRVTNVNSRRMFKIIFASLKLSTSKPFKQIANRRCQAIYTADVCGATKLNRYHRFNLNRRKGNIALN